MGRLAWIQRFNDVKTRGGGGEGTARDFFVARFQQKFHLLNRRRRRAARRNAVGKFGTELYSLSLSLSLSKGERIHWRNTRAWLLRLAPVVDQPDRYYAISSGLKW